MELLTGGELLDAVLDKGSYSEADARLCFLQLLRGVADRRIGVRMDLDDDPVRTDGRSRKRQRRHQ